MKKTAILIPALFLGAMLHGQNIITVCGGDSVMLVLDQPFNGTITWQQSNDNINWTNLASSNNDTLYIVANNTPDYFRAGVQEAVNCPVYYSASTQINNNGTWSAGVSVAYVNPQTHGTYTMYSASKLRVSWTAPGSYAVDHYEVIATESIKGTSEVSSTPAAQLSDTLELLKSATAYRINVRACADASCSSYLACAANETQSTTWEEYWQVQGTDSGFDDASHLISDANTLNYAFVYGSSWAPPGYQDKIRYYYNPLAANEKGAKPAITTQAGVTGNLPSVTTFSANTGTGFLSNSMQCPTNDNAINFIGQTIAVPFNGQVRMFMESTGDDNHSRIYSIDSQDGYIGKDFDSSGDSACNCQGGDFVFGANCSLDTVLGIASDANFSQNQKISDVRQFKIGYPMGNDWLWNGSSNSFMVCTVDLTDLNGPNTYRMTQAFAHYDSLTQNWTIEYNGSYPKMFDGMQAPSIVHMGGNRYKIYFSYNWVLKNQQLSFTTKEVRVVYGYDKNGVIYFDDWETVAQGRNVNFLWANNILLLQPHETQFDDFHMFAPTGDPDFQVMYTNVGIPPAMMPFVNYCLLLNP
ncbi:MAG: hypothetical protein FD123_3225 [Bacteroidetes bacterium]|nr:MAG: hypothetical protein FD123_3225 [Bacteroidota bacterium]